MYLPNLKLVPLTVPDVIWGTREIWWGSPWLRPRSLFCTNLLRAFVRRHPVNVYAKLAVRSFSLT